MDEFLEDRIYDAALKAQFGVQFFDEYAFFRGYSPSGENISFEVYYEDEGTFEDIFDVDEHAVMLWEKYRKSEDKADLRALLNDAQAIKNMYGYLYIQMYSLKEKLEEE